MNIETISDYITGFREQVVESGFLRDVNDFSTSGPNNQNNIVGLREIARNVFSHLERIHESDLPEALMKLFPTQVPKPFTAKGYFEKLGELLDDKAVQQEAFFASLQSILSELQVDLTSNTEEVERINKFIKPYTLDQQRTLSTEEKAIVSIIFKDQKTTGALNEFSHTLSAWNRILPLYHQLVTNTSPPEIRIVEVQNGSIDLVINLDVDVAVNLAELFKIGFMAYSAYLVHKKLLLPIAAGYFGNKKLLELDEQKEQVILENIRQSVAEKAKEQHEGAPCKWSKSGQSR